MCSFILVFILIRLQGKLLSALISGLSDRSTGVRKAYARATGHLVKVCADFVRVLVT